MINITLHNQDIAIGDIKINFKRNFNLNISQLIIHNSILYLRGYPDEVSITDAGFRADNVNNIIVLNETGEMLWKGGALRQKINNTSIELPVSYIHVSDGYLKAYYQSDHEVWYDLLTGEVV